MRTDKAAKLKIGYRDFTLRFLKKINKGEELGLCTYPSKRVKCKGQISIAKGMDDAEKANTILHEILHAICYTQGLDLPVAEEERVVNSLSNGLIAFIRDNPRFTLQLLKLSLKK